MRLTSGVRALGLLAGVALAGPGQAVDWPDVPVPEGPTGETVYSPMIYNGMSMRASRFTVDLPVEEVKAFYRKRWQGRLVDTPLSPRHSVLGHLPDARHYVTVELTPRGRTTAGQIGVLQLPDRDLPPDAVGKGFERLPRTVVAEDIVHMDTERRVRTLSMANRFSPYQNAQFYTRRLAGQGYRKEPDSDACLAMSAVCHVRYTRADDRITVTAMRDADGTRIVAVVE